MDTYFVLFVVFVVSVVLNMILFYNYQNCSIGELQYLRNQINMLTQSPI